MDFIEWSESMSVGIPLIDQDHKIIVSLINQFHQNISAEADQKVLGSTLNTLIDYTLFHFSREEQLMKACKYPSFKAHKSQHEDLAQQVTDIAQRFFEKKQDVIKEELLEFLKSWLINHILKQDMGYRPYAEDNAEVNRLATSLQSGKHQPQMLSNEPFIPVSVNWEEITILLISQNQNFSHIISTILKMANVRDIRQVYQTEEALQALKELIPDLIVYAWQADDQEAISFINNLRAAADKRIADIPVLLISAREEQGARESALAAGANHFIEEPIGMHTFFEAAIETLKG